MRFFPLYMSCVLLLCVSVRAAEPAPPADASAHPPSAQTYRAAHLAKAQIKLDGLLDEPAWRKARVERHFIFPWKDTPAPKTEFRAICDHENLYVAFDVKDADVFAVEKLRDKMDIGFEDRTELYF